MVFRRVPDCSTGHLCPFKARSLNLAIIHACKEPLVRNVIDTIQHILFCFNESGKHMVHFHDELALEDTKKQTWGGGLSYSHYVILGGLDQMRSSHFSQLTLS